MNKRIYKKTPKRLSHLFQKYSSPLYFITINTWQRMNILDTESVHEAFVTYAEQNADQNRAIGRYVIMPDHIHFFVRGDPDFKLSSFIRLLKQYLSKVLKNDNRNEKRFWQPGFFDHVMRSDESYAEKWNYVRSNPVRAMLASDPDDWPYQGEVVFIDRA